MEVTCVEVAGHNCDMQSRTLSGAPAVVVDPNEVQTGLAALLVTDRAAHGHRVMKTPCAEVFQNLLGPPEGVQPSASPGDVSSAGL